MILEVHVLLVVQGVHDLHEVQEDPLFLEVPGVPLLLKDQVGQGVQPFLQIQGNQWGPVLPVFLFLLSGQQHQLAQEVHGHQPSPVAQETLHLLSGLALQALLLLQVGHQDQGVQKIQQHQ